MSLRGYFNRNPYAARRAAVYAGAAAVNFVGAAYNQSDFLTAASFAMAFAAASNALQPDGRAMNTTIRAMHQTLVFGGLFASTVGFGFAALVDGASGAVISTTLNGAAMLADVGVTVNRWRRLSGPAYSPH